MKYPKLLGILAVLVLILSACSTAATPTNAPVHTLPPVATKASGTGTALVPSTGGTGTPATGGLHTGTPAASTPATAATQASGTAGVPNTGAACATVTIQLNTAFKPGTSTGGTTTSSTAVPSGTSTPATSMGTTTSSTATSGGATVASKDFLVDCNGMAVYVNMDDTPNSGSSSCTDAACTDNWKPLTVANGKEPMAGQGVDKSLLSTITRDDGTVQVTYNGWPLYLYTGDKKPGDKNGAGMDAKWYLIDADGNPIQQ